MFYMFCDAVEDMCILNYVWELLLAFYHEAKNKSISSVEDFLAVFKSFIRELAPADGFLCIS